MVTELRLLQIEPEPLTSTEFASASTLLPTTLLLLVTRPPFVTISWLAGLDKPMSRSVRLLQTVPDPATSTTLLLLSEVASDLRGGVTHLAAGQIKAVAGAALSNAEFI